MVERSSATSHDEITGHFVGEKRSSSAVIPGPHTPTAGPAKNLAEGTTGIPVQQGPSWQFGSDEA